MKTLVGSPEPEPEEPPHVPRAVAQSNASNAVTSGFWARHAVAFNEATYCYVTWHVGA